MKLLARIIYSIGFLLYYLSKLVQSNFIIAYDILTPVLRNQPGFIKVPVILTSDTGLLLFSNLVSMTPGTLTTDITPDKKFLEIHVLYMKHGQETMVEEVMKMQKKIEKLVH